MKYFLFSVLVLFATSSEAAFHVEADNQLVIMTPREVPLDAWYRHNDAHIHEVHDQFAKSAALLGGGVAWDLYWTAFALDRNKNSREANPLGFNSEARTALKIGMASGVAYFDYRLRRDGHHGWANALRYIGLAVQFGAGVNNAIIGFKR